MLSTSKVEETYTVEDFIQLGKAIDDIQYYKFSILSKAASDVPNPILYAEHNVLYDYEEELKLLAEPVEMTDDDYQRYRFKPKLLSYDLYGSTELFFVILFINGMCSIKDFDKKGIIKLIRKQYMSEVLEMIYNAEQNYINSNRTAIGYIE
jgi:hypothetical protein